MAKIEAAVRMSIDFIDSFNRHDIESVANLFDENCSMESGIPAPDGKGYVGKAALTNHWKDIFGKLPDLSIQAEEMIGFGNKCIARLKYCWTNGEGEKKHLRGAIIVQLRGERIGLLFSYVKG